MPPLPEPISEDIAPLQICPICAYQLRGLSTAGICPECGNGYDSLELILHGLARGSQANISNSRGISLGLSLMPAVVFINIFPRWLLGQLSSRTAAFFIFVWGVMVALGLFRRKRIDHPGGIQVRTSPTGILQINDVISLRTNPERADRKRLQWKELNLIKLDSLNGNRVRLKMQRKIDWYKLADVPIDAELDCPKGDAGEVVELIRGWFTKDSKSTEQHSERDICNQSRPVEQS